MHYRNGEEVQLGDKVTIDAESTPADVHGGAAGPYENVPDYYKTPEFRASCTGTIVGRDAAGTCGVAVLRPSGDVPRVLGSTVMCSQSSAAQLVLIEGFVQSIAPAYLKRLA